MGNVSCSPCSPCPSFNGAAPARARNACRVQGCDKGPFSFNGAAPARARNGDALELACLWNASLQRGRARAGAEWPDHYKGGMPLYAASTGPRPRGRGMLFTGPGKAPGDRASTGPRPRGRGMHNG